MSLLERIAERNGAKAASMASEQEKKAAEDALPDAGAVAAEGRKNYSGAIASAPDVPLEEIPASPEEQAQFAKAEKALAEAVYGPTASDSIVSMVMKAPDPVEGVGKAAHDLVRSIHRQMNLSEDVMFAVGESAVEQVTELVEASAPNVDLTEDQMAEAFTIGINAWMEANPDSVDPTMTEYLNSPPPAQL